MSGKRNRVRVRGKDRGKDHEEALKATDRHAGRRFLPLAGKLEVATI